MRMRLFQQLWLFEDEVIQTTLVVRGWDHSNNCRCSRIRLFKQRWLFEVEAIQTTADV